MSISAEDFPSIRRRSVSFFMMAVLAPTIYTHSLTFFFNQKIMIKSSLMTYLAVIFSYAVIGFACWKLSKKGMTLRHLIFGYQILNKKNNLPSGFLLLYVRELVALFAGLFFVAKLIVPAIFKRSMVMMDGHEDSHIVSGNYVSTKTVGQMRNDAMNRETDQARTTAFAQIRDNGFFHDNLFSTYAIKTSRIEALKSAFSKDNSSTVNEKMDKKAA